MRHFQGASPYLDLYFKYLEANRISDLSTGTITPVYSAWIEERERHDADATWLSVHATKGNQALNHVIKTHRADGIPLYLLIAVPSPNNTNEAHHVAAVIDFEKSSIWLKDPLEGQAVPKQVIERIATRPECLQSISSEKRTFAKDVLAAIKVASGIEICIIDQTRQQLLGEKDCTYWSMYNLDRKRRGLEPFERAESDEKHQRMMRQLRALYGGEAIHGIIRRHDNAIERYLNNTLPVFYQMAREEVGQMLAAYLPLDTDRTFDLHGHCTIANELNAFVKEHFNAICDARSHETIQTLALQLLTTLNPPDLKL